MATPLPSKSAIWEAIDLSESYLVCRMFEEAASAATSVAQSLRTTCTAETIEDDEWADMMESAAMVLLQSLKELQRTSEIFSELEALFGSLPAIPGQVFLTGACMQMSEGLASSLRPILEQFLGAWRFDNGQLHLLPNSDRMHSSESGIKHPILGTRYLEIVDVYVIQLLGIALHNTNLAISWTEKIELPDEKRQELLRRLQSLVQDSRSSSSHATPRVAEKRSFSEMKKSSNISGEGLPESVRSQLHLNQDKSKFATLKAVQACFWWFRSFSLKCGNAQLVLRQGKFMLWGTLIFFACYILRKKRSSLQWSVARQVHSIRKALVDAWQLAFSVQVNPLAAVQPLSAAPHGSSR